MRIVKYFIDKLMKYRLALHVESRISEADMLVLKKLTNKVRVPEPIVVEIGSFLGNGSTKVFQKELKIKRGRLYCVDTWAGNKNVKYHASLATEYDLFSTFLHNVASSDGNELVMPMLMDSLSAAKIFKDNSCDLIFIDGDHSYNGIKNDIEAWLPKVRNGGILCGHDCEGRLEEFDKRLIKKNKDKDFLKLPSFRFDGVHPGIVLCVDEFFGEKAVLWALKEPDPITGQSTIWHIKKE